MPKINLGSIDADVVLKDIKNIHLSVYPPTGRVRISAPRRMDLETIRMFAISKLGWIKQQQTKFHNQEREAPRIYQSRESHFYLGKRYLLKVVIVDAKPEVFIKHNVIVLQVRPGTSTEQRHIILQEWYRERLKELVPKYISKWEKKLNVTVGEFGIKRMRTRWGTCNIKASRIWLNLELAKKPIECMEYIIVHEMLHLFERRHNDHFVSLLNKHLPQWKHYRDELNRLPISHTEWGY